MSLTIYYTPGEDLEIYEPVDEFIFQVKDGKTVEEMTDVFVRLLLAMGYNEKSIEKYISMPHDNTFWDEHIV